MTKLLPCVISSLGGISYPKKKEKKEKKLKLVENLKKKKIEIFFEKI